MEILLGSLIIIVILLCLLTVNLLRKSERYEDMIEDQNQLLNNQNQTLLNIFNSLKESRDFINKVDDQGIFQSDDEVGTFFGYLKDIQTTLDSYFTDNNNNAET